MKRGITRKYKPPEHIQKRKNRRRQAVCFYNGDIRKTYIHGLEDIRLGIDIQGGVDVTFEPTDDLDATKDQMDEYEYNTGVVIVDKFKKDNINPVHTPGVLVKNHGPFTWGKNADEAVYHAVVAEQVAKMAFISFSVNPNTTMNPLLVEKHFNRKHGPNAYYGQKKK